MTLSDLKPGFTGRILGVNERSDSALRLLELGFTPGTLVTLRACAPSGDPMLVELRQTSMILRRAEAACVIVAQAAYER